MDPFIDIDQGFPKDQTELENFFHITGQKNNNYCIKMKAATTERPL